MYDVRSGASRQQALDNGRVVDSRECCAVKDSIDMRCCPHRLTKDGTAIHVLDLERRATSQQHIDHVAVALKGGPMEGGEPLVVGSRQPDPAIREERDDVGMTECGRPDECDLGVRFAFVRHAQPVGWREWYARTQLAIGADELVDEIYAPQAGCGEDGVDSSPARDQSLSRVRVVIRESGLEGRPIVLHAVDRGAEIRQDIDQRCLQARACGVGARYQKVERRLLWTAAVGVRARVDLSACLEEGGCDGDRIGRRLLADVLDSIGGYVVQERGVVRPS